MQSYSKDRQLSGLQECQEWAMAPSPTFSTREPRKIRLSVITATKKEVAVCGIAATVDVSIFRIHCISLASTIAPLQWFLEL